MLSHPVISDSAGPMDCSPPVSSAHGIFQTRRSRKGPGVGAAGPADVQVPLLLGSQVSCKNRANVSNLFYPWKKQSV